MEPIETQEQHADTGGKSEDSRFVKAIWFEQTVFECADRILLFLVVAIEGGEVKIGGCIVDGWVQGICAEEIYC